MPVRSTVRSVVAVLVVALLVPAGPATADHDQAVHGTVTGLECGDRGSARFCTGFLAGFDGVALDVDLALPAEGSFHRYPLVVVVHGWGGSKGSGRASSSYPGDDFFTGHGYAVMRYSTRGFGDSWGQTHLASLEVEIRDLQALVSQVVDDPRFRVKPRKIGVTGASYGGGHSYLIATRNEWTSPEGTPVRVAAVAPIVPWTDLIASLQPNGQADSSAVVGTMKFTYVAGLFVGGLRDDPERPYPNYISLLPELFVRTVAGEPYQVGTTTDPIIAQAPHELGELRSVAWQDQWFERLRQSRRSWVPIFQIQGWTDDLFPVEEALRMYRILKDVHPAYPIKLYVGDVGHPRAANKSAETAAVLEMLTAWFDFYLKGEGERPSFDVTAATTTPGEAFEPSLVVTETSPDLLADATVTVKEEGPFGLVNQPGQAGGIPADPILTEFASALVDPLAPHLVRTGEAPGGPVQVAKPVADLLPAGQDQLWYFGVGTVTLKGTIAGTDAQFDVRLWDRAPDGTVRLVDRGTYKYVGPPGPIELRIPLFGNAWRFPAGHELLLEVSNVDSPFLRPNNLPSGTILESVALELPVRLG